MLKTTVNLVVKIDEDVCQLRKIFDELAHRAQSRTKWNSQHYKFLNKSKRPSSSSFGLRRSVRRLFLLRHDKIFAPS